MARRRKKSQVTKKVLIIGACLLVLQAVLYLVFKNTRKSVDIRTAIIEQVNKQKDLTGARREQLKVQMAVNDYMVKNGGKPPANLQQLIPTYFDQVPVDPGTQKPFEYKVDNNRPFVGSGGTKAVTTAKQPGSTTVKPGETPALSDEEQKALVASLSEAPGTNRFAYDPTGKRDPFRPFDLAPKVNLEGKTALERFSLGQLKLTAILGGFDEPHALIEDMTGRGYTIKKGVKIGPNNGEVVEIQKDKILILETTTDFTGNVVQNTVEMRLRSKDQDTGAK